MRSPSFDVKNSACPFETQSPVSPKRTSDVFAAGTVQSPRVCHPLPTAALAADMSIFFLPLNAGVNVIARLSVSVLPLEIALLLAPSARKHWLLLSVPLLPSAARTQVSPASFNKPIELAALS